MNMGTSLVTGALKKKGGTTIKDNNEDIAKKLSHIADLYQSENSTDNPVAVHKSRMFQRAADSIKNLDKDIRDIDPTEIPGIGESISEDIESLLKTGSCERLDLLEKQHGNLKELTIIRNVGPTTAKRLLRLGITNPRDLKKAIDAGMVTSPAIISGERIFRTKKTNSIRIDQALKLFNIVAKLVRNKIPNKYLARKDPVMKAGSVRRFKDQIRDLDILIIAKNGFSDGERQKISAALADIGHVIGSGLTKVSVIYRKIQIDFHITDELSRGAAKLYFTGSKRFNEGMRIAAKKMGFKLNEFGLFKGNKLIASKTEEQIFHQLDSPWIPPGARESAKAFDLFTEDVITMKDYPFDLHTHTNWSDGAATIQELRAAAAKLKIKVLAITDHLRRGIPKKSLNPQKLKKQVVLIRQLNELRGPRLLAGCEVDIMADGNFAFGPQCLEGLDWVVASIHQGRQNVTDRYLRAIKSGLINAIGHPTGRLLINKREQLRANWNKIFQAAAATGVAIEINCQPKRMDLPVELIGKAKRMGVKFSIGTDAHRLSDLNYRMLGIAQAQKVLATKKNFIRPPRAVRQ